MTHGSLSWLEPWPVSLSPLISPWVLSWNRLSGFGHRFSGIRLGEDQEIQRDSEGDQFIIYSTWHKLSPGTMYPILDSLEERGLRYPERGRKVDDTEGFIGPAGRKALVAAK
jgi:hypothetical protein